MKLLGVIQKHTRYLYWTSKGLGRKDIVSKGSILYVKYISVKTDPSGKVTLLSTRLNICANKRVSPQFVFRLKQLVPCCVKFSTFHADLGYPDSFQVPSISEPSCLPYHSLLSQQALRTHIVLARLPSLVAQVLRTWLTLQSSSGG